MHLRYVRRVREILTVFLEEEFGYFIKKAQLHHYVPFSKRWKKALMKKEQDWRGEEHLRRSFERLGPTFIKFGQLLSLRPDIMPPEYILELEKMQDNTPVVPYSEIIKLLTAEFGTHPKKLFRSIEKKPIASASLAQVHKAQLKTGKVVVIKVQRPGIEKTIREDIEILRHIAHWMSKRKTFENYPLIPLVEEFKRWTLRELNFGFEASNTKIVGEHFKGDKVVIIPKVYKEYSTRRVLTLQYISGTPINDVPKLKKKRNMSLLIKKTYKSLVTMVLHYGIFHADPHPGNILIHRDKIAFVDFGIVGRFDDRLRKITLHLLNAAVKSDTEMALKAILDLQQKKEISNKQRLKHDLRDVLDQIQLEKLKDIQVSTLLSEILGIIHHHRIEVPLDFTLFAKTVITMEGVGLRYSPNFRLLKQTAPLIEKEMIRRSAPSELLKGAKRYIETYKEIAEKSPEYMLQTLKNISTGKIGIEITPQEFSELRVELEHSSGNIAIGLMIAAVTISAALVMQITDAPTIYGVNYLSFYGFITAGVLGIWLAHRTVFIKKVLR
jgi:ubiquinone biosynthesis protein